MSESDIIIPKKERKAQRDSLFLSAVLRVEGVSTPVTVRVRNLSNGGMMVDGHALFARGQAVDAELRGIGSVSGMIAWVEAGRAGVSFDDAIDPKLARTPLSSGHDAQILKAPKIYDRRPGLKARG